MSNFTLSQAIDIAKKAHAGQVREGNNEPYINHPLRVMEAVKNYGEEYQIVAILHDAIEDSDWVTAEYLARQGMKPELIEGVLSLTKRDDETYEDRVRRAMQNKYGRIVKPADVADNSDESRLNNLPPRRATELREKYTLAKKLIKKHSLQAETVETV